MPPPPEIHALQSSDAALRASQDHAGAAVGLRSILERRRRCGLNLEVLATLDEQIAQVERKIRQHFDDYPDLKRRRDLLTSIPGIGRFDAAGSITFRDPTPGPLRVRQSCRCIRWIIAMGATLWNLYPFMGAPDSVRLAMLAFERRFTYRRSSPLRFNPALRIFAERLLAAGKHKASHHRSGLHAAS